MKSCPAKGSKSNKQLIVGLGLLIIIIYLILDTISKTTHNTYSQRQGLSLCVHCAHRGRTQVPNNRDLHRRSAPLLNKCVPIEWNLLWSETRRIVKYLPANRLGTQGKNIEKLVKFILKMFNCHFDREILVVIPFKILIHLYQFHVQGTK